MRSSVFGAKGGRYSVSRRGTRNSWIMVTVGREGSVYPDWTGSRLLETIDRSPESALRVRAHILQSVRSKVIDTAENTHYKK